jgi:hypothetical protein
MKIGKFKIDPLVFLLALTIIGFFVTMSIIGARY